MKVKSLILVMTYTVLNAFPVAYVETFNETLH